MLCIRHVCHCGIRGLMWIILFSIKKLRQAHMSTSTMLWGGDGNGYWLWCRFTPSLSWFGDIWLKFQFQESSWNFSSNTFLYSRGTIFQAIPTYRVLLYTLNIIVWQAFLQYIVCRHWCLYICWKNDQWQMSTNHCQHLMAQNVYMCRR